MPKRILIEDKASDQSVIQDLKLIGHANVKLIERRLDKVTRFVSAVDLFQIGKILLSK